MNRGGACVCGLGRSRGCGFGRDVGCGRDCRVFIAMVIVNAVVVVQVVSVVAIVESMVSEVGFRFLVFVCGCHSFWL